MTILYKIYREFICIPMVYPTARASSVNVHAIINEQNVLYVVEKIPTSYERAQNTSSLYH